MVKEPIPHNAHDRSQRLLFSHPRVVRDLLLGFVHEPWIRDLDFTTLESLPSELLSGDLPGEFEERRSDIVWKVHWRDREILVVVLLELQSSLDHDMALRLGAYVFLLCQRLRRQGFVRPREPFPIVFPVVFYNGESRWSSPLEVGDLFQPVPEAILPYRPALRYAVIDERRLSLESLDEDNVVSGIVRAEQASRSEELDRALQLFEAVVPESPDNQSLRRDLLAWLSKVVLPSRIQGIELPRLADLYEFRTYMENHMHSWSDQWKEEGLQEGIQRGMQQGVQQGRKEGLQQGRSEGFEASLCELLAAKFGPDSVEAARPKLRGASLEQLQRWIPRVLSAQSVDDVFREPS